MFQGEIHGGQLKKAKGLEEATVDPGSPKHGSDIEMKTEMRRSLPQNCRSIIHRVLSIFSIIAVIQCLSKGSVSDANTIFL